MTNVLFPVTTLYVCIGSFNPHFHKGKQLIGSLLIHFFIVKSKLPHTSLEFEQV